MERRVFASRAQAQAAIAAGTVRADGAPVLRSAQRLAADAVLDAQPAHPFASRGGVKLAAALDRFGIDPHGCHCLDIGASTGGFTDVLLSRGATRVTAVDVGHGQLSARLRGDSRVAVMEETDARRLAPGMIGTPPALIVADLSFISLTKVLPSVLPLAAQACWLVALVKPQFEAGREHVGRGGIVRDEAVQARAVAEVIACMQSLGWRVLGQMPSPIDGGDGNREFLIAAERENLGT